MKYVKQFGIIIAVSFIGEGLNALIPLPVPGSIYGFILLFLCLNFKIIALESVKETGVFLIEIMPLMFIPAAVGLLNAFHIIKPVWIPYVTITVVSTLLVTAVSGRITQWLAIKGEERSVS